MTKNITHSITALAMAALLIGNSASAQETTTTTPSHNKAYWTSGVDGFILSSAYNSGNVSNSKIGTPRFTGFFHIGVELNYDFSKNVGFYTGANIKNIGFIEKFDNLDSTVKRRVYTFGIPVGLKFGDLKYGSFFVVGGGVDFPFNYREKGFVHRGDKTKFSEWFSSRTPAVMPYVFIGAHLRPALSLKLQYYPTNFLNQDFEVTANNVSSKPYSGYDVKLVMLTFGFNINYRPRS